MVWFAALLIVVEALAIATYLFHRRRLRIFRESSDDPITLILPITGKVPGLEELLDRLAAQTQPIRRLIVTVEATEDPAFARATALADRGPFPIDVVVAGLDGRRAQKVTNLLAAFARLRPDDRIIACLDADIRPASWWLATLVGRIARGQADAVTGYRWHYGPTNVVAEMITIADRDLAVIPQPPNSDVVWGGTMAFDRKALEAIDPARVLASTITDDLPLGRALRAGGFRLHHRSALLVPTPIAGIAGINVNFAVRQYRILLLNRPRIVAGIAAMLGLRLIAWTAVAVAVPSQPLAAGLLILVAATSVVRDRMRAAVSRIVEAPADPPVPPLRRWPLLLVPPLIDVCHLGTIVAAASGRTLRWGRVLYRLDGVERTEVIERRPYAG